MEKGKASQASQEITTAGVNDEKIGLVVNLLDTHDSFLHRKNGFEANYLSCNNESMKKLAGTGSQVSRCFDKHCQTDAIIQEVKRSKEIWILRAALILFFAYYAATKSGSELFFTYPIQQSCPAHDSSSSPSNSYHTPNTSISTESPSIIPSLSQDQCSEFDSLETTSKKLEFLAEVLNWKPMKYANIVSLQYIYSYQSCKYFIGVSQRTIYKFSLYTDYTKVLSFGSVTSSSLSPDGNFMAFHENTNTFIFIDIDNFKGFTLYKKFFQAGAASSLFVFSPDSKYLFYARDDLDQVLVYNTLKQEKIIELNTEGDGVANMIASKNLHHLIVKDKKNNVKVFNIGNSNYQKLCTDENMKKKLATDFPEIEELI